MHLLLIMCAPILLGVCIALQQDTTVVAEPPPRPELDMTIPCVKASVEVYTPEFRCASNSPTFTSLKAFRQTYNPLPWIGIQRFYGCVCADQPYVPRANLEIAGRHLSSSKSWHQGWWRTPRPTFWETHGTFYSEDTCCPGYPWDDVVAGGYDWVDGKRVNFLLFDD
eukprot:TRINITY_DN27641_c0_g1_i1.p1 TRINITY_DN27641_c0_g1~~TRINITY_DN27641_c0_g1_i1.p1  ORF type:complete len:167 (-),score=8.74 TRINITY_DN27641_c0_g1_i1:101-601(-)